MMDADFRFKFRRSMSRRPVRTALARRRPTRDTSRAAAGRAGSFNSGKNRVMYDMYEPIVCSSAANCSTGMFAISSAVISFLLH